MDLPSVLIIVISFSPILVLRATKNVFIFLMLALIAVIIHGLYLFGINILFIFPIIYIISTIIELISLITPFNFFGVKYRYSLDDPFFVSKIRFLGVYPLEVTLAWVVFKYISFCVAFLIVKAFTLTNFWILIFTPLILVSIDLAVDPVAVNSFKLWMWYKKGKYFGIPFQNFIGWITVGFVSTLIFSFIEVDSTETYKHLFITPVLVYPLFLSYFRKLIKVDKAKSLLGATPIVFWSALGIISLIKIL